MDRDEVARDETAATSRMVEGSYLGKPRAPVLRSPVTGGADAEARRQRRDRTLRVELRLYRGSDRKRVAGAKRREYPILGAWRPSPYRAPPCAPTECPHAIARLRFRLHHADPRAPRARRLLALDELSERV